MSGAAVISCSSDYDVFDQTNVLLNISRDLTDDNVVSIKFLIKDLGKPTKLEHLQSSRDLLHHLRDECDIKTLLPELLYTIGRHDLIKRYCKKDKDAVEKDLAYAEQHITPYRKLLYTINDKLDSKAIADLKIHFPFIACGLQSNSGYDLFLALEEGRLITADDLDFLITMLMRIQRADLVEIVEKYQDIFKPLTQRRVAEEQLTRMTQKLEKLKLKSAARKIDEYRMTNSPRGHCVIINNVNFPSGPRNGSESDCRSLTTCFQALGFKVSEHQDLNKKKVQNLLVKYGKMDHSKYDCLAVCVMSHGDEDKFKCADGKDFSILELTQSFCASNCPSLAGKPKLFFIQACRGDGKMIAATEYNDLEIDGHSTASPSRTPDMADMVLAQSTYPGHEAYRDPKFGSLFIKALCEVLNQCHCKLHLVDMLIEVNRRVGETVLQKDQTFYTQCPQLFITLRKAVWFRPSS